MELIGRYKEDAGKTEAVWKLVKDGLVLLSLSFLSIGYERINVVLLHYYNIFVISQLWLSHQQPPYLFIYYFSPHHWLLARIYKSI